MNEILFAPADHRWPRKGFFQRLLWAAAGSCAMGGLCVWRLEDRLLRIERRDMALPGLGSDLEGAKLAHVSDLHCSPLVMERYLRHCCDLINAMEADFVAITGDFITGPRPYARRVASVLRTLSPRVAAVACLGNHDYGILHPRGMGNTRGLAQYVGEQLSRADIFVMANECRTFRRGNASIQFVGLEDYWTEHYDAGLAFELVRSDLPTVALCHNPDAAVEVAARGAHWVLAGHTHGRPPARSRLGDWLLPAEFKEFNGGYFALADGRHLYVNRGLGYARRRNLNYRPEITLFTLRRAQAATDRHVPRELYSSTTSGCGGGA